LINELRETKTNVLVVDAGNLFTINRNERDRLKAEILAKGFHLMGYDVLNLGIRELTYGAEFLNTIAKERSFSLVSANVRIKGEDKLFAKPYIIKEFNGLKVGIIGIIMDLNNEPKYGRVHERRYIEEFETNDPEEALAQYLPELRSKVDFLILLSHIGFKKNKKLIKKFNDYDLLIGAYGFPKVSSPLEEGETILVHGSKRGSDLNYFDFKFDEGKITSYEHEVKPLSTKVKIDRTVSALVSEFEKESKRIHKEMAEKQKERTPAAREYIGADACKRCHQGAFQSWVTSPHARAFDTLKKKGKEEDNECLKCHVTGFKERSGYGSDTNRINLEGVQCEACHSRGSVHAEKQDKDYGKIYQFVCRRCHNQEFSPDFEFWKYMKRDPHFSH
jgi:2',3'-cyclic-nucleotide 2'-phosphodiesterase (5'-nucleotidase family)